MGNLEERPGRAGSSFLAWGGILVLASVIAFIYGLVWLNLVYIPAHQNTSEDLPAILILMKPIYLELIGLGLGITLITIGFFKRCSHET
ncbi:hypothetical protein KSD_26020 [Ktedonobacter sp. SOSP1-85]|uniref:hypothetical protein n=1 Tax=Ktedonobacter sp. SOSP1-85 TaxID=2778367 RepID=UPI00191686AF|nr:hypothetical protein [Ktedonobacter sp. SOSP1-85]GHO74831.1 hypothetical protein KSD_26020 [Ktedonobacter sp. SOSP1-85]